MSVSILAVEARERFNHHESKKYLKEKYTNLLTVAYSGGMFKIDQTLISFLNQTDCDIITDIYDNPVRINRLEFLNLVTKTYNTVMSKWLEESSNLSKMR
jgi:hypothetical protein